MMAVLEEALAEVFYTGTFIIYETVAVLVGDSALGLARTPTQGPTAAQYLEVFHSATR